MKDNPTYIFSDRDRLNFIEDGGCINSCNFVDQGKIIWVATHFASGTEKTGDTLRQAIDNVLTHLKCTMN